MTFALFEELPRLERHVARVPLGQFPTPVASLAALAKALRATGAEAWVKRDDVSSLVYGGNKVRTLEVLFGQARALGHERVLATGAFGSNHALACALHAPRVFLEPEALLFPQPASPTAALNLRALTTSGARLRPLPHWSALPFAMAWLRRGPRAPYVMVPGGATPLGALGYVSAALELGRQIAAHELPPPRRVVLAVGSTCTSAGLLVGIALAGHLGRGFTPATRPVLTSVRVSPWPITSRFRILSLAVRSSLLLHRLSEGRLPLFGRAELSAHLEVDGSYFGPGYGRPNTAGNEAESIWKELGLPALDGTYSAKAAARVVTELRSGRPGPVLFWSTKSSVPLPPGRGTQPSTPAAMAQWLARAEHPLSPCP